MSRLNPFLLTLALVFFLPQAVLGKAEKKNEAPAQGSLHELMSVWKDHKGQNFTWKDLQGKTVLMSMVYTSCQATCPLIISELSALQKALPAEQQDKLVVLLFTFDPKRDTQERISAYAKERKLHHNWRLLRATEDDALELAAVLNFRYKKMESGEFAHSNIFTVLDQKGRIQHQQLELFKGREQTVNALQSLLKTAAH
jgi:protein SCO1/2